MLKVEQLQINKIMFMQISDNKDHLYQSPLKADFWTPPLDSVGLG